MIENNGSEELKDTPNPVPNEQGGFTFSSAIKIFDPNSKEVVVQQRGDD